jgi:RNA polymerase sigma factor (sigma-70 family)
MTSDTPSFGDLLARARAGDRDALHRLFGFVVDEHGEAPRLRDVARRRMPKGDAVRDLDDSDGVMLSALMRGYEEFAAFRGSELQEFVAWLRQILVRRIARRFRSPAPRIGAREPVDEMVDRQGADAATPSEAFARDETVRDVRDAVARLPDDLRIVVELRLDGLEAAAIAEALGLEAAAVRKREQRAREHLRTLLEA